MKLHINQVNAPIIAHPVAIARAINAKAVVSTSVKPSMSSMINTPVE